jgi:hypothetical protein
MTTSQTTSFLFEVAEGQPIPLHKLAYFRERQRNRAYDLIIGKFLELEKNGLLTRAELARRIGRAPEQVTRWIGTPGNWTLDTMSDLMLAMGAELAFSELPLLGRADRNFSQPNWLSTNPKVTLVQSDIAPVTHAGSAGNGPPLRPVV